MANRHRPDLELRRLPWSKLQPGIYCLVFPSGHYYVGQSNRLRYRYAAHLGLLRQGTHPNPRMQSVYAQYGAPALRVECLCAVRDLDQAEQIFLDEYFGRKLCLNLSSDAAAPARGRVISLAERENKRQQGKRSWANGTNGLISWVGLNNANLVRPEVRAKLNAIKLLPESRKHYSEVRTMLHKDPIFKAKHKAGVAKCFANEEQQQNRLSALRLKHMDPAFTESRIARCRAACQKAVECVETGQVWTSGREWQRWIKKTFGVSASLLHVRQETLYKGLTFRYVSSAPGQSAIS